MPSRAPLRARGKLVVMGDGSNVELVRSPTLASRVDYAYAATASRGVRMVFSAGACPLDRNGEVVGTGDVAGQAEQAMINLSEALRAAGAGLGDVVKTTVYVASSDRDDLVSAWDVVRRHFGDHDAPSTLLGVTVLGYRHQRVESRRSPPCPDRGRTLVDGLAEQRAPLQESVQLAHILLQELPLTHPGVPGHVR